MTAFASSLAYLVVEVENFPDFADLDVEYDGFINAGIASQQAYATQGSGAWIRAARGDQRERPVLGGGGGGSGGRRQRRARAGRRRAAAAGSMPLSQALR